MAEALCECGCGQPAPIAPSTDKRRGYVKGLPVRFVANHAMASASVRAKLRSASLGHEVSAETRSKISAALSGRTDNEETRAKKIAMAQRGADSPVWRGTDASYNTIHTRARRVLPFECSKRDDGGCKGRLEVAFRHDAPSEWVKLHPTKGPYYAGLNPEDGYWRLCSRHHYLYDARAAKR